MSKTYHNTTESEHETDNESHCSYTDTEASACTPRERSCSRECERDDYDDEPERMKFVYVMKLTNSCFFVGQTDDLQQTFENLFSQRGPKWTLRHPPVSCYSVEKVERNANALERSTTIKAMETFGWKYVRGHRWQHVFLRGPPIELYDEYCKYHQIAEDRRQGSSSRRRNNRKSKSKSRSKSKTPIASQEHSQEQEQTDTEVEVVKSNVSKLRSNAPEFKSGTCISK